MCCIAKAVQPIQNTVTGMTLNDMPFVVVGENVQCDFICVPFKQNNTSIVDNELLYKVCVLLQKSLHDTLSGCDRVYLLCKKDYEMEITEADGSVIYLPGIDLTNCTIIKFDMKMCGNILHINQIHKSH